MNYALRQIAKNAQPRLQSKKTGLADHAALTPCLGCTRKFEIEIAKYGLGAYLHHRSKAVVCMAHFLPPLTYLQ